MFRYFKEKIMIEVFLFFFTVWLIDGRHDCSKWVIISVFLHSDFDQGCSCHFSIVLTDTSFWDTRWNYAMSFKNEIITASIRGFWLWEHQYNTIGFSDQIFHCWCVNAINLFTDVLKLHHKNDLFIYCLCHVS